jgi:hypothetical protein
MPIVVTCPGCRARFQVSEQFAGKTGPCPKCKVTIRVPTKEEEVKIHAPAAFGAGGRTAKGELVLKPIARKEFKLKPIAAVAMVGSALLVLLVAWVGRGLFGGSTIGSWIARSIGLLLVSPPLVLAGYGILRDDESEPYGGLALYLRAGICAAAYAVLWGVFGYAAGMALTGELWNWLFVAPPFLVTGSLIALACLDLDFGSGFLHYCFYLLLTMFLRWAAGMGWIWEAGGKVMG